MRNCLFLGANQLLFGSPSEVQFCTILPNMRVRGSPMFVSDCIVAGVARFAGQDAPIESHRIVACNLFGTPPPKGSKGCFSAHPGFRDPANLDYRLMPGSPCIGRATDGGDIGVRYTPEMIEMCKKALELRAAGIIDF